jgi:hypothetical protein
MSNTNTVKLDNGTGLSLTDGASFTLGFEDKITLVYNGSVWKEISRSTEPTYN